jgi:hypothetical protein
MVRGRFGRGSECRQQEGANRQQRGPNAFDERRAVTVGLACRVSWTAIEIQSICAVRLVQAAVAGARLVKVS